ncbi:MAG TPA: hypothetical protein VI306_10845 [Pyrinomonadaceae bacterium]
MTASSQDNRELRQYLLGLLPESKREAVDQRVLIDSEFYEELQATEDELVDEYLSGRLNDHERKQFESHFLIGSERQNKVMFGRSWQSVLENLNVEVPATNSRPGFLSSFRVATASWRTAVVVTFSLAGLLGLSSVWFAHRWKRPASTTPQIIGVTLTSGASRSVEQPTARLPQPPANSTVNVELEVSKNTHPAYKVDLTKEREGIRRYDDLSAQPKDGHFVVNVPVDAALLDPGDYTFELQGTSESSQSDFLGTYHLRVTR